MPLNELNTGKEWLSHIANDDEHAFSGLFHQYYSRIYGKALQLCKIHATAEDIAQQVFLKAWERRGELASLPNAEAWLFTVARNQFVDLLRDQLMQEKYEQYALDILDQESDSPEALLITRQQQELLERSLATLSPKQQEVYRMNRQEGMTYVEIAAKLGISRDTVKEYMGLAIARIKQFLKEHQNEWLLAWLLTPIFY